MDYVDCGPSSSYPDNPEKEEPKEPTFKIGDIPLPEDSDKGPWGVIQVGDSFLVTALLDDGEHTCKCDRQDVAIAMASMCNTAFQYGRRCKGDGHIELFSKKSMDKAAIFLDLLNRPIELGMKPSPLRKEYDCEHCGDTGFVNGDEYCICVRKWDR